MGAFPKFSIATKLYAIFALLATGSVVLALVAVVSSRRHAAMTADFQAAFRSAHHVERIHGLIHAVGMETHAVQLASDAADARDHARALLRFTDRIGHVVTDWQHHLSTDDAERFQEFLGRLTVFQDSHREFGQYAISLGPAAAREWAQTHNDETVRNALSNDINALSQVYAQRAEHIYAKMENDIATTAWWMFVLGSLAVVLAGAGAFIIGQAVTRPLRHITRITETVAEGANVTVPYGARQDEVGALARSIAVFQRTMHANKDLNRKVTAEAEARTRRQEHVSAEIQNFTAEVETSIAELGKICEQMLAASRQLSTAADHASQRTTGATSASNEASSNIRDIASAADELAASVMEIDRQVSQSNGIAEQAVDEAERTNLAVKELDEAARRIGDVISLINNIAEQTNLLALNATIEAARAGESGRGFAVVAGEVKALAGQTARATEEIAAQIADMQQATQRSIAAIGGIEHTIRDIGSISGAIAAAVTEQGAATQEIARSVEIAVRRTGETASEVGRVGEATENTRHCVTTVELVAEELGSVASRIRSQVDEFFQRLRAA